MRSGCITLRSFILLLSWWCAGLTLYAQNLEKIGSKEMLQVSGSASWNAIAFNSNISPPGRDPLTWYFNGALNFTFLDVALPFTYSYSNQQSSFTQPFNMQSFQPHYKWIKGFAGTTSLNWSPYTLGGHMFTGGAVEISPKGFTAGLMYGRLKKAVEWNGMSALQEEMSYQRMGYAFRMGYESEKGKALISFFHAQDEESSLTFVPPETSLTPQENSALALSTRLSIAEFLSIEAEGAVSALTRNTNAEQETTDIPGFYKWIIDPRTTTEFYHAWKAAVVWKRKTTSVSLQHEHVDPGFTTLGAYFFNNDLESYTLAPSFRLWKGKLNVALNSGLQRNNLDKSRLSTTQRWVGSAQLNCNPSSAWMIGLGYSNFTSFTRNRPQADPFWTPSPADSLDFYQLSQQGSLNVSYQWGKKWKKVILLNGTWQVTGQQQLYSEWISNDILNGNLSWSSQHRERNFAVTGLVNFNRSVSESLNSINTGPGIQLSKGWKKNRVKLSAGTVYNRNTANGVLLNHVWQKRLQCSWNPSVNKPEWGRPSVSLQVIRVVRMPVVAGLLPRKDVTMNIQAVYTF